MDRKFQGLKEQMNEGNKKLSDRLQELELKVQRSPVGNTGPQEEKSGERDNHATKGGGQEITPPEQQSRQAASSSHGRSRFSNGATAAATTAAVVVLTTATTTPSFTVLLCPRTFSGLQAVPTYSFRGWRTGTPTPPNCWN